MKEKKYNKEQEIEWKNMKWYVISVDKDNIRLLLKNILSAEQINKCCEDKFYISVYDGQLVRLSDCIRPSFDFNTSYINKVLLNNFKKELDVDCEVTLLTEEIVETLSKNIRKCNDNYWTKTSGKNADGCASVIGVSNDGYIYSWAPVISAHCGIRPIITLKISDLQI